MSPDFEADADAIVEALMTQSDALDAVAGALVNIAAALLRCGVSEAELHRLLTIAAEATA